jgi:hypothetical protein
MDSRFARTISRCWASARRALKPAPKPDFRRRIGSRVRCGGTSSPPEEEAEWRGNDTEKTTDDIKALLQQNTDLTRAVEALTKEVHERICVRGA